MTIQSKLQLFFLFYKQLTKIVTKNLLTVLGTASFFLSPQIRNRISIFLIRNRKSAIARLKAQSATASSQRRFKIIESATASPQIPNSWSPQPQVCNFVIFQVCIIASSQRFMDRVEKFCNHPCPEVICSELISKHKWKVVTCRKYNKRTVNTFHAIKGITYNRSL